jgi:hypothetical protein
MGNTVRSVGSTMLAGATCCAATGAVVVSRPIISDIGRPSETVIAVRVIALAPVCVVKCKRVKISNI